MDPTDRENFEEAYNPFGISHPLPLTKQPMGNARLTPNKANQPVIPENFVSGNVNAQWTLAQGFFQSLGFLSGSHGWIERSDGTAEFNGSGSAVSVHFNEALKFGRITLYFSDGTTPYANLRGNRGDVCLGGPNGQPFYCSITGSSTWVGM